MNPWTPLLGYASSALLPLGLVLFVVCLARSESSRARLSAYHSKLDLDLRHLQAPLRAQQLIRLQLGSAIFWLALAVMWATPWPLPLLAATALCPRLWLHRQRRIRARRIEQQLDGFLLALSHALRANPSLGQAIAASAQLVAPPLCQELSLLLKEHNLGMPLDHALRQLTARVRSPLVSAAIATLRIARNKGGNLSETLEASAASLREMARLEGVVRSKTAEGRAQSWLIALIPLPLIWMLTSLDAKLFEPLWTTVRGHLVLGTAALLWMSALLWARKIVAVDV